MAQALRVELETQATLHEYDALRAELMSLQQRTHQFLGVTIGGAGAVLSAGVVVKSDNASLEVLLLGAAALLGLVVITFLGHMNKQMEIGLYLHKQAIRLRRTLQDFDDTYLDASGLLAWEVRYGVYLSLSRKIPFKSLWLADAMQRFELAVLACIPLALMGAGCVLYFGYGPRTDAAWALVLIDGAVFWVALAATVLSLYLGAKRAGEGRRDTVRAQIAEWDGGPWVGVDRLADRATGADGAKFVALWAKDQAPPARFELPGGAYVGHGKTADGRIWRFVWMADEEQGCAT
ncbi:MAG: hypothetical protein ABSG37_11135 [Candidatus Limnocylindrales bacterium]|jgi:hypothetical protein